MNCPDCRRVLPDVATACRCGWIAVPNRVMSPERLEDENARRTAEIAELTRQARKNLEALGLARRDGESVADWQKRTMAYCREKLSGVGRQHELS